MTNDFFKLDRELTIVELETRHELSLTSFPEACKGCDDPYINRCK